MAIPYSKEVKFSIKHLKKNKQELLLGLGVLLLLVGTMAGSWFFIQRQETSSRSAAQELSQDFNQQLFDRQLNLEHQQALVASMEAELAALRSEDQFQRNERLQEEISNIQNTYRRAVVVYEDLLRLREQTSNTQSFETSYTAILVALSRREYQTATEQLTQLQKNIDDRQAQLVAQAVPTIPPNVPAVNTPPESGYRRQSVETEVGTFLVDIVTADLNSTRVVVETASEGDCADNCPVDSLASFVSRAGGFAGINGPYFCPAEYPSCAGKTNSFDTLLMNSKKVYFNSDNNVYSTVPAIIFSGNSARVVRASQEWGRDTGVDAVIASQPLLLFNGEVTFGGSSDPKQGSRGSRSFIGVKDNNVYIGVVRSATVAEVARVLRVLGLQHGINLDSGGSTALMSGGRYIAGPGRNTPFGIVLVRK